MGPASGNVAFDRRLCQTTPAMANFAANAQIHEYSLIGRLLVAFWFFLLLFPLTLPAQQRNLSTSSKKAAALYQKANEHMRARNFEKAIEALNDARQKDTTFGE